MKPSRTQLSPESGFNLFGLSVLPNSPAKKLLSSPSPLKLPDAHSPPPVVTLSGNVTLGWDWHGPMSVIGVTA